MANSSSITGKSVVVTGGASGIGLALVRYFASHSCKIALFDISQAAASSIITTLSSEFPSAALSFQQCDVSSWEQQRNAFEAFYKEVGRVDIVCANAGIVEAGKFLEDVVDGEALRKPNLKTLDIDLTGTLYSIKLGVHYMRKNKEEQKGLIICTSSNAGLYPFPMAPMYAISKHGVVGAVRSFAKPLKPEGIRINALCPNCIETGLADNRLMSSMQLTPMETLLDAVEAFCTNTNLSGVTAEVSGQRFTFREHPEHVDDITKHNLAMFETLGYA